MKNIYTFIRTLFSSYTISYNPILVSTILTNSLKNKREGIKTHRLEGLSVSIREAKTQHTKSGNISKHRIVIGLQDDGCLYLLDGRHLLEAYRLLRKNIPNSVLHFVTSNAKNVFTTTLKSLDS